MSACYQPASALATVASELTSSRGLHLSATDCAKLLRRHREQVTVILDQLSVTQCKPFLDDLSSLDVFDLCGFNLMSVYPPVYLYLYGFLMLLLIFDKI